MDKTVALQILALLENARIAEQFQPTNNPHTAEFALRLASAHVATLLGYGDRAAWAAELREAGLVEYNAPAYEEHQTALDHIKAIIEGTASAASR